jgi:hypothetical protein
VKTFNSFFHIFVAFIDKKLYISHNNIIEQFQPTNEIVPFAIEGEPLG